MQTSNEVIFGIIERPKPERLREEFYCDKGGGGCGKYFATYLRKEMTGNYSIRCPNTKCNHVHFRKIVKGLVTSDRHDERLPDAVDIIIGLASTLRDTPWHDSPEFKRSQMKALRTPNG